MLSEELKIYKDTYTLTLQLFKYQNNVPKFLRYGEYGRAVDKAFQALDLIYVANSDVKQRAAALKRFLQLIGSIRSRVRLFLELKYLSIKQGTVL